MDKRWGFMAPWCEELKQLIGIWTAETDEYIWEKKDAMVKVRLPRQIKHTSHVSFGKRIQKIQEALALLVAVHHADKHAYTFLVVELCGLKKETRGHQLPISTTFLLDLDLKGKEIDGTIEYDLALFCGTSFQLHPSVEYLKTLKKIAALDKNLKGKEGGVSIEIPVKLDLDWYQPNHKYGELLHHITMAEKQINAQWNAYRASEEKDDLLAGELRCSFVLEPMRADLGSIALTTEVMEAIERQIADNVWFSSLDFYFPIERQSADNEFDLRATFGLFLRRLFDSTRRKHDSAHTKYHFELHQEPKPSQIEEIRLLCDVTMPARDFEAMCSALVLTQTTKKISLDLDIRPDDETNHEHRWKWLAYTFFSKRARSSSSLETLIIACLGRMSERDARAFASVFVAEHPEEMLFGTPSGLVDERDATLKTGAPIRWEFDEEGQLVEDSNHLVFDYPVPFVRTFSDDGNSEWVNVLVSGFGRCQVERSNLEFCAEKGVDSGGVTSLTVAIDTDTITGMEGILPFIESIGPTLMTLAVKGANLDWGEGPDVNSIIRSCPNLQDLTISRELVDIQLDFSEYRAANESVPELAFEWTNFTKFSNVLCDSKSPLTKCTKRLNIALLSRLALLADAEDDPAPFYVDALVDMLNVNERLEFLEVRSPYFGYVYFLKKFASKPIHRQRKPLSTKCKVAFLSLRPVRKEPTEPLKTMKVSLKDVQRRSAIEDIDLHVIANIFSFAALPVRRLVYYNSSKVLANETA